MIYLIIILIAICLIFICGFILGKCYASFYYSKRVDVYKRECERLGDELEEVKEKLRKGKKVEKRVL